MLKRITIALLLGAAGGAGTGFAAGLATAFAVNQAVGHMCFEMSGLFAVFFAAVGGAVAGGLGGIVGVAGEASGLLSGVLRWIVEIPAGVCVGALSSGGAYYLIVAPRATVPFAVVFWVGVVVMVGGAAGGATGVVMSMVPLKTASHPRDSGGSPFS